MASKLKLATKRRKTEFMGHKLAESEKKSRKNIIHLSEGNKRKKQIKQKHEAQSQKYPQLYRSSEEFEHIEFTC